MVAKRLALVLSIVAVVVIVALGSYAVLYSLYRGTTTSTTANSTTSYFGSEEIRNVNYCTINNMPEYLDVYVPGSALSSGSGGAAASDPLVMYVHGGGWVQGDKSADWNGIFKLLLDDNFVVASVNYYLPNASATPIGFPTNIEDVACALRFLRSNAVQYHIDPSHVGVFGDSAGANLVSLLGLAALNGTFGGVGGYAAESDAVQAVADCFGPANITDPQFLDNAALYHWGLYHLDLFQVVFGNNKTNMARASPVNYAAAGAPPFLIEQGENDTTVPMSQSVQLYNVLQSHGDDAELILVQNAGHEFVQVNSATPISPSLQQLLTDIVNFFNAKLR
jgi:acetyl esterase/lipase